ncbi:MAG: hypothetical protein IIU14_00120 [Ruminococcus sp.]|nr:hypothetical protein [Ruminococcus sp.]
MNAIAMTGRADAKAWENSAEELNERARDAVKKMGDLLASVDSFCKGTLADDLVGFGNRVMSAAESLLAAMKKIFDVINELLNLVSGTIEKGVEFIGNMAKPFLN